MRKKMENHSPYNLIKYLQLINMFIKVTQEVRVGNKLEIDMEVEFILFYCQLTSKPHHNYSINRKSIKWKLIYIHFASF